MGTAHSKGVLAKSEDVKPALNSSLCKEDVCNVLKTVLPTFIFFTACVTPISSILSLTDSDIQWLNSREVPKPLIMTYASHQIKAMIQAILAPWGMSLLYEHHHIDVFNKNISCIDHIINHLPVALVIAAPVIRAKALQDRNTQLAAAASLSLAALYTAGAVKYSYCSSLMPHTFRILAAVNFYDVACLLYPVKKASKKSSPRNKNVG